MKMIQGYVISNSRLGEEPSKGIREIIRDHETQRSSWAELNSGRFSLQQTKKKKKPMIKVKKLPGGSTRNLNKQAEESIIMHNKP